MQHASAILASPGKYHLAAKMMGHQHQSVTDSQYGNAERKNFWIDLRGAFVVNTGRAAGKDDAVGFCCGDFSGWCVEANNFRIHLTLPHAAGYDLRVLRAEIEDENF